jgi:type II secretion system protein C
MRNLISRIMDKIRGGKNRFRGTLTSFRPRNLNLPSSQGLIQSLFSSSQRPTIHRAFKSSMLIFLVGGVSSILGLWFQDSPLSKKLIPGGASPAGISPSFSPHSYPQISYAKDLRLIKERDLFYTDRSQASADYAGSKICEESKAKSSLPIKLFHTVVMQDAYKSLASLQVQNKNETEKLRITEKIGSIARLDQINRLEIIIKNLQNGKCEMVANGAFQSTIPNKISIMNAQQTNDFLESKLNESIKNEGNDYKIAKSLIQEKMADPTALLSQAKAVPITNADGTMSFRIDEITPGSIYSYLGIQNGDTITKINGNPITSFNEIMNLFGQLQTLSSLKIMLSRDGMDVPRNYEISNQ